MINKLAYFSGNSDYGEEYYPYNEYLPTGMVQEYGINLDRSENHQRDGKEFDEFKEFKRKQRIRRLKRLRRLKMLKDKQNRDKALSPHPFYQSLYSAPAGFEGLNTSSLEYYNGTIGDNAGELLNPYYNTYQAASIKNERILIRAMSLLDYA